jgi:hypothetical protein
MLENYRASLGVALCRNSPVSPGMLCGYAMHHLGTWGVFPKVSEVFPTISFGINE